jgi:phosphopantetheinyl transferase
MHTLSHLAPGCLVIHSSTQSRRGAQTYLALALLRALGQIESRWRLSYAGNALTLQRSTLGQPCLLLGDRKGPSISFSQGNGRIWGAMANMGCVGIDIAYSDEFADNYPLARAFRQSELDCVKPIFHNDIARGAALLWSAKEAAVKATGAGFNRFDPLEVKVNPLPPTTGGMCFKVLADRPIAVWSRAEQEGWLSIALVLR